MTYKWLWVKALILFRFVWRQLSFAFFGASMFVGALFVSRKPRNRRVVQKRLTDEQKSKGKQQKRRALIRLPLHKGG